MTEHRRRVWLGWSGVEGEMFEDWVELAVRSGPWRRVPL